MAEGYAKKYTDYKIFSAGTQKSYVNKKAIRVMAEDGIDISSHTSKTISDLKDKNFFKVFTLCSDADSECPLVFNGLTTHVGFQDPPTLTKSLKDEDEQLKIYREVRDQIKKFILNIEEYIWYFQTLFITVTMS